MQTTANFSARLKDLFSKIHTKINRSRLLQNTNDLWRAEFGQTFDCYHASARLAESLLKKTGCENVERIAFPADGKTVFQDKTMPLGWRASKGRLEVVQSASKFSEPVVADYERHPFHLIKGSVSTPPEGIETRLISEEDLYAGADPRGAMVLLNPENRPTYRNLQNTAILGIVADNLVARYDTPLAIQWANACTESYSWHTRGDEQPRIGFVVSPYVGDQLRIALREGEVRVRVTSDGERYEDKIEAVTGIVPGEDEREIWLLAHLYEPLANDNSSGVACALEIAHALQDLQAEGLLPLPRFTMRLVFAMECYGFAAFAEHLGGRLRDRALCAVNIDAMPILAGDRSVSVGLSQSACPSSADYPMEELLHGRHAKSIEDFLVQTEGVYADDRLLADSTIGLPTLWFTRAPRSRLEEKPGGSSGSNKKLYLWHNSTQDMSCIEPEAFHDSTALYGTWVATMLSAEGEAIEERLFPAAAISNARLESERTLILETLAEENSKGSEYELLQWLDYRLEIESARLKDFSRFGGSLESIREAQASLTTAYRRFKEEIGGVISKAKGFEKSPGTPWQIAETMTISRTTRGLPRDLAVVPAEYRDRSLEFPVTLMLVHADGKRTVAELLRRAQWELRCLFSPAQVMEFIGSLQFLAQYGYIGLSCSQTVTKAAIVGALAAAGVKKGDLLLVHSALSPLGVVEGGAETVIDALLEAVGEAGTLLMPTFTRSFLCFERGPARRKTLVPFHGERGRVTTGIVPEMFRKRQGVFRTKHPSHSIAGTGPLAKVCLSGHGLFDAPTGPTSPWAKLHELNGKIVFLGAPLATCTFLHYLENVAEVDYLVPSTCVVDDDERGRLIVSIPRNVPGPRDFYRSSPENAKIFRRLREDGLEIQTQPIGFSEIKVLEAAPFYKLGMAALQADPKILLQDPAS